MRTSGRTPGVGTAMGELVVAEGTAVVLFWQLELSTELGARCGRRGRGASSSPLCLSRAAAPPRTSAARLASPQMQAYQPHAPLTANALKRRSRSPSPQPHKVSPLTPPRRRRCRRRTLDSPRHPRSPLQRRPPPTYAPSIYADLPPAGPPRSLSTEAIAGSPAPGAPPSGRSTPGDWLQRTRDLHLQTPTCGTPALAQDEAMQRDDVGMGLGSGGAVLEVRRLVRCACSFSCQADSVPSNRTSTTPWCRTSRPRPKRSTPRSPPSPSPRARTRPPRPSGPRSRPPAPHHTTLRPSTSTSPDRLSRTRPRPRAAAAWRARRRAGRCAAWARPRRAAPRPTCTRRRTAPCRCRRRHRRASRQHRCLGRSAGAARGGRSRWGTAPTASGASGRSRDTRRTSCGAREARRVLPEKGAVAEGGRACSGGGRTRDDALDTPAAGSPAALARFDVDTSQCCARLFFRSLRSRFLFLTPRAALVVPGTLGIVSLARLGEG